MEEIEIVRKYMKLKYRINLDDLEISNVPGYWQDKEPKVHHDHPLHGCIGCKGPFRAAYVYTDSFRDPKTGKFASPYRTWRKIYNQQSINP